jgi:hypothetical protein
MSKNMQQTIAELETQAKQHEVAAGKARALATELRTLLAVKPKEAASSPPKSPAKGKRPARKKITGKKAKAPAPKRAATRGNGAATRRGRGGKPTLADHIRHVLEMRRKANAGATSVPQLYEDVQKAGYAFGGGKRENAIRYLRKTLRKHKADFKRSGRGQYALA